ncbi:hypothetical protein PO878_04160 [Iamia majanohamensis]|uniref:Uncharacterized protein n=1 Tax=Iamia majanohamensis TaxID=467976 RepID=A0AAE9Y7D5_9ACTN|nr:hypothetical protein [Iamia majanohamensis]WCO67917.1 hypothetical protein PO878_04160 [Iamia majanohamensis]
MNNDPIQVTTVDGPPPIQGRGRPALWPARFQQARDAYPQWVRVGPFGGKGQSAIGGAARKATKRPDVPGNYEITQRTEDGNAWVYVRHLPEPTAVAS